MGKRPVNEIFSDEDHNSDKNSIDSSSPLKSNVISKRVKSDNKENIENGADTEEVQDDNYAREAGQICKIYLENFMCHVKFTMTFCRHLNFITGHNGSGKSAIVSALQLCLGATARNTGRGSNLQGFIREGSNGPAIAQVTLFNEGKDAYKPEIYGSRIVVERKIMKGGPAIYTLYKGEINGKTEKISHEKKELEGILRNFNIYVDNPCCILTQEDAKKFIFGSDNEKYDFFMKATGLATTKKEIKLTQELLQSTKLAKEKNQTSLLEKKEHLTKLKEEVEIWGKFEKEEFHIKLLQAKALWAELKVSENKLSWLSDELESKTAELQKKEDAFASLNSEKSSSDNIDAIGREIEEITTQIAAADVLIAEKNESVRQCTRRHHDVKSGIQGLTDNIKEFKRRLTDTRNEIEELRGRSLANAKGREKELREEEAKISSEIRRLFDETKDLRERKGDAELALRELEKQLSNQKHGIRSIETEINRLRSNKSSLLDSSADADERLKVFGKDCPAIVRLIRSSSSQFREPVFGPCGKYIKMKTTATDYAFQIEVGLAGVLNQFIVTNTEDARVLTNLCKQRKITAPKIVIQPKDKRYHINAGIANGIRVIDQLIIENDEVFNTVLDRSHPEGMYIVKSEHEADALYLTKYNGLDGWKEGVSVVITEKGDKLTYRRGNRGADGYTSNFQNKLASDISEMVRACDEAIRKLQLEHAQVAEGIPQLEQQIAESRRNFGQFDIKIHSNDKKQKELNRQKSSVAAELSEIQEASNIDTSMLEAEETDIVAAIDNCNQQIENLKIQLTSAENDLNAAKGDKKFAEKNRNNLQVQCDEKQDALQKFIAERLKTKDIVAKQQRALDQVKAAVNNLHNQFESQQEAYNEMKKAAEIRTYALLGDADDAKVDKVKENDDDSEDDNDEDEDYSRWKNGWDGVSFTLKSRETAQELERLARAKENRLKNDRKEITTRLAGRSMESIRNSYLRARTEYSKLERSFSIFLKNLEDLEKDYAERTKKWVVKRKDSSAIVNRHFNNYLNRKGFTGAVLFNHRKDKVEDMEPETMRLMVNTGNYDEKAATLVDVKNLSGGEKSFTTFSFLLAVGHVMESPFRLMDEYDVFLDQESRKLTTIDLQEYAKLPDQFMRQFISITPQDLSWLVTSPDLKLLKMKPTSNVSSRGLQQTALPF